jgi:cellulose synthase/poly-beta-1,6-N-acetylglucosamine synthase-like glycosyltransferase
MFLTLSILLWFSIGSIVFSYIVYPLILKIAVIGKKEHNITYERDDKLPYLSVLISAFNEETVISSKIESLLETDYPKELLQIFIGSDDSTDKTNEIINGYREKFPELIQFFPFNERRGKPKVINDLAKEAYHRFGTDPNHLFILTDANVLLTKSTLFHLAKHFKDSEICLVDSNICHSTTKSQKDGISKNEKAYISREVMLKHLEGKAWGSMIGPLGGCFALRSTHYSEVPTGYLVDDFYIAMKAFEKGGKAINDLEAICFEDVSNDIGAEFRRKTRISSGNFANLRTFWKFLLPKFGALSFAFFSHKVLRWLGPIFLIIAYVSNLLLAFAFQGNLFYQILFFIQSLGLIAVPLLDSLLNRIGINIGLLRYITYFLAMNVALLKGLIIYIKGVQNNVWQPTKRNIR